MGEKEQKMGWTWMDMMMSRSWKTRFFLSIVRTIFSLFPLSSSRTVLLIVVSFIGCNEIEDWKDIYQLPRNSVTTLSLSQNLFWTMFWKGKNFLLLLLLGWVYKSERRERDESLLLHDHKKRTTCHRLTQERVRTFRFLSFLSFFVPHSRTSVSITGFILKSPSGQRVNRSMLERCSKRRGKELSSKLFSLTLMRFPFFVSLSPVLVLLLLVTCSLHACHRRGMVLIRWSSKRTKREQNRTRTDRHKMRREIHSSSSRLDPASLWHYFAPSNSPLLFSFCCCSFIVISDSFLSRFCSILEPFHRREEGEEEDRTEQNMNCNKRGAKK